MYRAPYSLNMWQFCDLYMNGFHLLFIPSQLPHHIPFTPTGILTTFPIRAQILFVHLHCSVSWTPFITASFIRSQSFWGHRVHHH